MISRHAQLYRSILKETRRSLVAPDKKNKDIRSQWRSVVEKSGKPDSEHGIQDLQNALHFLASQREHKILLHRYNPLLDYTSEERIKATANRVGLDMPQVPKLDS